MSFRDIAIWSDLNWLSLNWSLINSANNFADFLFTALTNKIFIASLKKEFLINFLSCLKVILKSLIWFCDNCLVLFKFCNVMEILILFLVYFAKLSNKISWNPFKLIVWFLLSLLESKFIRFFTFFSFWNFFKLVIWWLSNVLWGKFFFSSYFSCWFLNVFASV